MHALPPKTALYGPVPQVEGDQAKHFQMQPLAVKPFCSVNCFASREGALRISISVQVPGHISCLVAWGSTHCSWGLLIVPWMPSETVGCCLVLWNNNQVFFSFFLFSPFLLLKLPSVTISLYTPHTICCSLVLTSVCVSVLGEDLLLGYVCFLFSYVFSRWTVDNCRQLGENMKKYKSCALERKTLFLM